MNSINIEFFGYFAAILTTAAFLPQLIKTIKNSHKSSEKEDWIALAECIRSDQVPASDVAKFFSNKRFYGWYKRKYLRY